LSLLSHSLCVHWRLAFQPCHQGPPPVLAANAADAADAADCCLGAAGQVKFSYDMDIDIEVGVAPGGGFSGTFTLMTAVNMEVGQRCQTRGKPSQSERCPK
jgi:hypothetical protein